MYGIEDVEWEDNLEADPHKFSGKSAQTESPSNLDLYRVFPDESKLQRIKEVLPVPTNDVRTAFSCIDVYQVNIHGEKFYGNQETLDMFPENKKSGLKKNGASLETGLMDCEWDEFGNFELFSGGSTGSADEFSWISSPYENSGRGVTYDFNSSNSELNPPKGSSKFYEADMNFFLEDELLDDLGDHSSLADCSDTKWMDAPVNIEDMAEMKSMRSHHRLEMGTKSGSSGFSNFLGGHYGLSPSHSYETSPFNDQVKSDNGHTPTSGGESERGSNMYPFSESNEKSERFINDLSRSASTENCTAAKIHEKMHLLAHQVDQSNKPCSSLNHQSSYAEQAQKRLEVSNFEMDYSTEKNKNIASELCDDGSLVSSYFMKLHDLMDQLDLRTKLCIRDGLYRLARNAEIRGICDSSETPMEKEYNRPSEHLVETGTNATDRSIAQLLFYSVSNSQ